ncbi:hypothetical protein BDR06DRAFT_1009097 [Suillus hirtellus]|nr:hypothetical protein BDR06DRAFT_1009097 [Suillus hirtellus]
MSPVPKMLSSLDSTYVKDSDSANSNCFKLTEGVQEKCEAWLLACNTLTVGTSASQTLLHSPQYVTISHPHEHLLRPGNQLLFLPSFLKAWADNITYCSYVSTSIAETNQLLVCTNDSDSSKVEVRKLDVLKAEFHIMYLKKKHAQAEADMFSKAIAHTTASSSGSATDVSPPNGHSDWFDDWVLTSSIPSNTSSLL